MKDLREAVEMALETFEKIYEGCGEVKKDNLSKHSNDLATLVRKDCIPQIEALRQALNDNDVVVLTGEIERLVNLCTEKDELIKLLKEEVGFAERGYTKRYDL